MAEATPPADAAPAPAPSAAEAYGEGRWLTVGVLSAEQTVQFLQGVLINTLFPVLRAELGLDLAALGILTSVTRFARMVFGPIWALLGDRFGRKLILVISAFWGVFLIAAGLAQTFSQLVILYGFGVLGTVSAEPISNGLVSDLFRADERGKVYGAMRGAIGAGTTVVTPLLGLLAGIPNNQGWRIGMFIMGGAGVFSGLLTWAFAAEPSPPKRRDAACNLSTSPAVREDHAPEFRLAGVAGLLAVPTVALLAIQLIFMTSLVLLAFLVTFLVDVREYTTQQATVVASVFFLGFTISSFLGGVLGDRFAKKNPRNGRVILMQLSLVAVSLMSFLAMQVNWARGAVETVVWLGFGLISSIGMSGAILPMVSDVVLPQYRSSAFALLFSFIQGALAALFSLAVGSLAQRYGLRQIMLYTITVPYAINAVFWFAFYKAYPRDQERMRQRLAGGAMADGGRAA